MSQLSPRKLLLFFILILVALAAVSIDVGLRPVKSDPNYQSFLILPGESFSSIANRLYKEGLIRSRVSFKIFSLLNGSAIKIQPGRYELSPHESAFNILEILVGPGNGRVKVTIPEGLSIYEVDKLLTKERIIEPGKLVSHVKENSLEGRLFPDTYYFEISSSIEEVISVFLNNFEKQVGAVLSADGENFKVNLILASLIEEEVPLEDDRRIVAGILKKRLASGIPLQVDASLCYAKIERQFYLSKINGCHPLNPLDLKIDSPYNTYLYKGWPPGPIASPGLSAVLAALEPKPSPYWFYLSDPKTGKTVFSKSLEEHNRNISIYLKI